MQWQLFIWRERERTKDQEQQVFSPDSRKREAK